MAQKVKCQYRSIRCQASEINVIASGVLFEMLTSLMMLEFKKTNIYLGAAEVPTTRNVRIKVLIAIILHNCKMLN